MEPFIDKQTMEIHHGRHYKVYVDNYNKAVAGTDLEAKSVEDVLKNIGLFAQHAQDLLGRRAAAHSGMLPCLRGGLVCRLLASSLSERIKVARVSCGRMISSM